MTTVPFNYDLIAQGYKPICIDGEEVTQLVRFEGVQEEYNIYGKIGLYVNRFNAKGIIDVRVNQGIRNLVMMPPKAMNATPLPGNFETHIERYERLADELELLSIAGCLMDIESYCKIKTAIIKGRDSINEMNERRIKFSN